MPLNGDGVRRSAIIFDTLMRFDNMCVQMHHFMNGIGTL